MKSPETDWKDPAAIAQTTRQSLVTAGTPSCSISRPDDCSISEFESLREAAKERRKCDTRGKTEYDLVVYRAFRCVKHEYLRNEQSSDYRDAREQRVGH
jgi:hypothetical protein